ncbi:MULTISPECIES: hypothetical protein [Streptomyces]|uniref:Uncharacterized protein n=1 Tax=Streptomyces plicatus TaxID=1922 RepID=A0ABW1XWQ6_STRPL|nr:MULTISPECIES: hypothetical protein [Streptomyces]RSS74265.1 hypothetical protein EF911_15780 [Streptomyces sp. WAC06128]GGZ06826.1 hypothetical protein GCM10010385_65250 [Streptomyces geysiriensis]GGZ89420.1 hypothetical protein GCM10010301_71970 [Streptomyces plicatus]
MSDNRSGTERADTRTPGRAVRRAVCGPWTVLCAVAAVLLGPATVTASALEEADAAPPHRAVRADPTRAYPPADTGRRRTA